jgi:hypothetical protein
LQLAKATEGYSVVHGPGLIRRGGCDHMWTIPALEGYVYPQLLVDPAPLYQAFLVKRDCFSKKTYPDARIWSYQEWDFSLSLAMHFTFGYVTEPLFVYDVQDDSISRDSYRSLLGYEQIVLKWQKEIINICGHDILMNHYKRMSALARNLSGPFGKLHYLSVGAKLSRKSLSWILFEEIIVYIKHLFKQVLKKIPFVYRIYTLIFKRPLYS